MVALVGGVVQVQSDEVLSKRGSVGIYYPSVAETMDKGNDLAHKGDYEKALQYYNAAIGQDPKAWPLYFNRADVFTNQRKWDLAIQDLNTALRLAPGLLMVEV